MPLARRAAPAPPGSRRAPRPSRSSGYAIAGYSTVSRAGPAQVQEVRQRGDQLLGADARADVRGLDGHAEATRDPGRGRGRAARRCRPTADSRSTSRSRRSRLGVATVGHGIARRSDRAVDDPARQRIGEALRARRAARRGTGAERIRRWPPSASRLIGRASRTPRSDRRSLRGAGPARVWPVSPCTSTSTSPARWSAASTSPRSYGTTNSLTRASARSRSPIVVSSSGNPAPVAAEIATEPGIRVEEDLQRVGVGEIGLVPHEQPGHIVGVDLVRARCRPRRCGLRRRARWRRPCARAGRRRRPLRASSGTPRRVGAAGGARSRPCRRARRSRRREGAGAEPWDRAWRTAGSARARPRA